MSCLTAIEVCKPINVLCCVHLQAALGQSNTPAAATSAAAIGTPAAATAATTGTGSASGLAEYDKLLSERLQPFLTAAAAVGGEVSKEAYRFKPQLYPTSFRLCASSRQTTLMPKGSIHFSTAKESTLQVHWVANTAAHTEQVTLQ